MAVMVTGVDLGAGVGNTQPTVKNAISKTAIAAKMYFLFRIRKLLTHPGMQHQFRSKEYLFQKFLLRNPGGYKK